MNPFSLPSLAPPGAELVDSLQAIAHELTEEAEASFMVGTDAHRAGQVAIAAGYIERAIGVLIELEGLSHKLAREVEALAVLCGCGHDRGDHLVDAPHPCEACECDRYVAADRPTEPCLDKSPTEPPPAPPSEVA